MEGKISAGGVRESSSLIVIDAGRDSDFKSFDGLSLFEFGLI